MKNSITKTLKLGQLTLMALLFTMFSFSSFAQNSGGGHGHGGPGHGPGPGHGGGGPHPNPTCNAHFNHHRDSITNGVVFSNYDGTGAATYAWDFGDGSTSTSTDPSHVFPDTGYYYVCLTINHGKAKKIIRNKKPAPRYLPKASGADLVILMPRRKKSKNKKSRTVLPIKPNSSAAIAKIESPIGSGK